VGAEALAGIEVEDDRDQRRFGLVDIESAFAHCCPVAEGMASAAPATLRGFPFHAGDHPVDDGGPLELGEHPEHLDHHPPRS
jgi:hypothetical protein